MLSNIRYAQSSRLQVTIHATPAAHTSDADGQASDFILLSSHFAFAFATVKVRDACASDRRALIRWLTFGVGSGASDMLLIASPLQVKKPYIMSMAAAGRRRRSPA